MLRHAGADAGSANGVVAHPDELLDGDLAGRDMPGAEEALFDIDMMSLVLARRLVAADHDERWDIEPGGGHELSRGRLVAGSKADHAVEEGAFDRHLDVIHDQIAARQDVAAAMTGAGDEVTRSGRAYLERQAPGGADGIFGLGGDTVEMAEADCQVGGRVDHRDLRFLHVSIRDAERLPLCPAHRPAGRAPFEIASQISHRFNTAPPRTLRTLLS